MLEKIISEARRISMDARQRLSAESAAAIEQVYDDIVALKDFIAKGLYAAEGDSSLDAVSKKTARRGVIEQAGRKLEVVKAKWRSVEPLETMSVKLTDPPTPTPPEDDLLQFLREKEIRDRLSGMSVAQIRALLGKSPYDDTNPLLLRAILNSPAGFEPVSKETVKKIQQALAAKIRPRAASEPQALPDLASRVDKLFNQLKKELDRLRRDELPSRLSHKKDSNGPPFEF